VCSSVKEKFKSALYKACEKEAVPSALLVRTERMRKIRLLLVPLWVGVPALHANETAPVADAGETTERNWLCDQRMLALATKAKPL